MRNTKKLPGPNPPPGWQPRGRRVFCYSSRSESSSVSVTGPTM